MPVSARDFVFTYQSFRRFRLPDSTDPHVTLVRSVRAVGPKTVRVVLRSRFAPWGELFDLILPRHALVGENLRDIWTDVIDNPKTGRPIASGPFFVSRYERGAADQRLVLRRNPRYWGRHPAYLDQVVLWWSGLPQNELIDAMRRGRIHRTDLFDPQLVAQARARPGCESTYGSRAPGSTSSFDWDKAAIRPCKKGRCGARWRTGSIGAR